jgi:hypothetical protein
MAKWPASTSHVRTPPGSLIKSHGRLDRGSVSGLSLAKSWPNCARLGSGAAGRSAPVTVGRTSSSSVRHQSTSAASGHTAADVPRDEASAVDISPACGMASNPAGEIS